MKQYFAINHHENVSRRSMTLSHHLINYPLTKLLADEDDPVIGELLQFYTAIVGEWNNGFMLWRDAHNVEMGTTVETNALLDVLSKTKAPNWVVKVFNQYPEGSPQATALVPHKRQAFISGSVLERITAIFTFINGIRNDVSLAAIKTDAESFVATLTQVVAKHEQAKKDLASLSKSLEPLRIKATTAMLMVEGSLIKKFYQTPEQVDLYFDVSAMRNHTNKQISDEGYLISLLPSEIKLLDLTYSGKEIWEVANNGEHDVCVFFSNLNTLTTIPEIKYLITSGESLQIDLNTLPTEQRFAYAANLSNEDEGEMSIVQVV